MRQSSLSGFASGVLVRLLIVALLMPSLALAQDADPQGEEPLGWSNVMRLRVGDTIIVTLDDRRYGGKVDEVGPDSLSITTTDYGPLVLPRTTVKEVRNTGRLFKTGVALVVGGLLFVGATQLMNSGRDLNTLSNGRIPGNHSIGWEVTGFAISGAGAWMLVTGGGKTIYKRLAE
jgi:hypothetical protein